MRTSLFNANPHPELTSDAIFQRSAQSYTHPNEVVRDPRLTFAEKREILASWASDVRAVLNAPPLRQLDNGAVVHIDTVLRALNFLSEQASKTSRSLFAFPPFESRLPELPGHSGPIQRRSRSDDDDDDDDPPPCPVVNAGPLGGPLFGGEAAELVLPGTRDAIPVEAD